MNIVPWARHSVVGGTAGYRIIRGRYVPVHGDEELELVRMSAQRRRVHHTLRQYRALLILAGGLLQKDRQELERDMASVASLTKAPLLALEERARSGISEIGKTLGLLMKLNECMTIVEDAIQAPYDLLFIPKHFVDTRIFSNMAVALRRWPMYPPHTRIGVDAKGNLPFTGQEIEWRLLEAAVFEDMAMLWNEAITCETDDKGKTREERIPGKKFRVLKRATVKAAFSLLEAYLNGISVDILLTVERAKLSKATLELLEERDDAGRFRPKSLRAKVLGYPRIAIGTEHPSFQDSSASDFRFVLEMERRLRDAIVHPHPRFEAEDGPEREKAYFEINISELGALVDNVISLVRRIDSHLAGRFGSVQLWLHDRGEDRRFPVETFF